MVFCKLLTVLVLIHNIGGLFGAEVGVSIVGGEDAPKGRWPWMVHLNITDASKKKNWRCGGTILNEQWVLTAAHCWDEYQQPDHYRSMASIGSHSLTRGFQQYKGIANWRLDDGYQRHSSYYVNDIALLKLKSKIKFKENVEAVKLPTTEDTFGPSSECWIIGWGHVENGVPLQDPETLQQLKISIIPSKVCKVQYPELTSNMLCAGDMAGGKDACEGDYGGPLVCRTARGFVQVGIMSYGSRKGCALPGRPGVYTQVSKYLSFINENIHHAEEASTEV